MSSSQFPSGAGGFEFILDDLGGADSWDKSVVLLYDDTVLEGRGNLEAIFILHPRRVTRDTGNTPSADSIEEAYLRADVYVMGIIHCSIGAKWGRVA